MHNGRIPQGPRGAVLASLDPPPASPGGSGLLWSLRGMPGGRGPLSRGSAPHSLQAAGLRRPLGPQAASVQL